MSIKPYLRDLRLEAIEQLTKRGHWIVAGVEATIPWPKVTQVFVFDEIDFILRASDEKLAPSIALNAGLYGFDQLEGQDKILKLASALAWKEAGKVEIFTWAAGGVPIGIGKGKGMSIQDFMDNDNTPMTKDANAWIALALFREGLSTDNPFYSFLNFYKVISSIHRNGISRGKWIKDNLDFIINSSAKNRVSELKESVEDISEYLFTSGRNAISHAEKD